MQSTACMCMSVCMVVCVGVCLGVCMTSAEGLLHMAVCMQRQIAGEKLDWKISTVRTQ